MMNKKFFGIILFLLFLTCLSAGAQVFYKIERPDLPAPSYILGTHHLAPPDFTDRLASLPEAMAMTAAVVGEVDMTVNPMQMQMEMQPYMMAPADSTLSALLSPEEMKTLSDQFRPLSPMAGLELSMLDAMRPMVPMTMATLTLVQKSMPGFDPNNQLDASFQKKYVEEGKKVIPLETLAEQAQLLYCSTPITKQLDALRETLSDPEKGMMSAKKLNEAYLAQDLDELLNITKDEEEDPAFMVALLDKRNHNWMQKLPGIMSEQPSLIVVGAGHLPGDKGLLHLLKEAGYTITPMK